MRTWVLALMLAVVSAGCANRALAPYAGRWTGGFYVEKVVGAMPIRSAARNSLTGFLQLYLTDNRCVMHLEGEQEGVDVKGQWELKRPDQIEVRITEWLKFDDAGGALVRDPNKTFLPTSDLKAALRRPIGLKIVKVGGVRIISGLESVGPVLGHFEFTKETPGK